MPDVPSPFISSLMNFYKKYSQRSVMSDLLNIFHSSSVDTQLLTELYEDAQQVGAATLARCLHFLIGADESPETLMAKHVATLSFELDVTLRLIAHTINKSSLIAVTPNDNNLDEASILLSLNAIKEALETYDAKALEHITNFAAQHAESHYGHNVNRLKQLASVYDFEGALELINQLIDTINNE